MPNQSKKKQKLTPEEKYIQKQLKRQAAQAKAKVSSTETTRKTKLRTSLDIYNRIIWDKSLNLSPEDVIIGYTDTVLGDQELPVSQWISVDKGGDIPMHHIIYFRWHHVCLWDRGKRLDRLFGSGDTHSGQLWKNIQQRSIQEYMDRQNNNNNDQNENNDDDNDDNDDNDELKKSNESNNLEDDEKKKELQFAENNDNEKEGEKKKCKVVDVPKPSFMKIQFDPTSPLAEYFPRYPMNQDGFAHSYVLENVSGWKTALNKYGVVVIQLLSREKCEATIEGFCEEMLHYTQTKKQLYEQELKQNRNVQVQLHEQSQENSKHKRKQKQRENNNNIDLNYMVQKIDFNNPYTWKDENFPGVYPIDGDNRRSQYFRTKFLTDRAAFHRQAFLNRINDDIYHLFVELYKRHDLQVTVDNWGIYRGTKYLDFTSPYSVRNDKKMNDKLGRNQNIEKPDWRKSLNPHWDVNPWKYSQEIENGCITNRYQGALSLFDNPIENGVHLTLPGCYRYLKKWCKDHEVLGQKQNNKFNHRIDINDPIVKYMQFLPVRAGDFIVWDYGQLHGTSENYSNSIRLMQYIRMFPSEEKYIERDNYAPQKILKPWAENKGLNLKKILGNEGDDRALMLLGLKKWPTRN